MNKWIIVLIVIAGLMLACVGLVIVANYAILQPRAGVVEMGPVTQVQVFPTGQSTSEEAIDKNFTVSGPATLELSNAFGDVEVTGQDGLKEIRVEATKKALAVNPQAAAEALQQVNVRMSQTGDVIKIDVEQPNRIMQNQSVEVSFRITAPAATKVNASTASGSITLDGVEGAQKISSSFGNVRADNVAGPLIASTESGEVSATGVQAGDGSITLSSSFGNVSLDNSGAAAVGLELKSGAVRLTGSEFAGGASLKSSFGSIMVTGVSCSWLDAYTQSGEVELTNVQASEKVKVFSSFGALRLAQVVTPLYDLSTHSGDVRVDGASGKVIADASQGNVTIVDGMQATLDLKSQSGSLGYSGSLGAGPNTLTSSFGNVQLNLPADSAFNFDLESKFGEIRSDFEVKMGGKLEDSHWIGTVNGGGPEVRVSTSGDVSIEKR